MQKEFPQKISRNIQTITFLLRAIYCYTESASKVYFDAFLQDIFQ